MKEFLSLSFDVKMCRAQLKKFRKLLDEQPDLRESADIMPFFKKHPQLTAFIASRFPQLMRPNRVAYEYDLFGDFACDVVVGNSNKGIYCFVEFEDGASDSIFRTVGAKATPEWSPRFDHGFSQIVDWFWKLDEMRSTPVYADRFGTTLPEIYGMLVAGRDKDLGGREQRRLKWRLQKVLVDSHTVACSTFDELCQDMEQRLMLLGNK